MTRPTLWLDSNIARSPRQIRDLFDKASSKGIRLVVPAQVYLEVCRQRREETGDKFSQTLFDSFLEQKGIEVIGVQLDRTTAATWAELLNRRYTTSGEWKEAKRKSVKAKLPEGAEVPVERVPMTTDWWIALAVEHDADAFIAVEDKGEEWRFLREQKRAGSFDDTLKWLDTHPDAGS